MSHKSASNPAGRPGVLPLSSGAAGTVRLTLNPGRYVLVD